MTVNDPQATELPDSGIDIQNLTDGEELQSQDIQNLTDGEELQSQDIQNLTDGEELQSPESLQDPKRRPRRLVFGLGAGYIYSLGPDWRDRAPVILKTFDNDILISTVDMPSTIYRLIGQEVPQDRLYLDSGGFTLFKDEVKLGADNPEFHLKCEKMKAKFLKILKEIKVKETFELDNEYFRATDDLLDPRNYCREEVKAITGFYPTPVFKMPQGFEYWKALCESPLYPKLAIGGLAQTRSWNRHNDELKIMMDYARSHGKKVHLLGCQNVEAFKTVQPDTVDYSIFQMAINVGHAKKERPDLTEYRHLGKHATLYATARAMARGFLYDCYDKSVEDLE